MKPSFRAGPVHVRVPATSANLGPGYDALGLALDWHDDVVGRVTDDGLTIDVAGEGVDLPRDETHLVLRAMRETFARLGGQPRGLELSCANRIPHGRGLGSSAAAIVAGVHLARALVLGGSQTLPDNAAFALAAELEGHPDNVAACCFGGLTIAWTQAGTARAVRAAVADEVLPVVLVPPFESSTKAARALLPASVPHGDAALVAGRSALLVAALGGADDGEGGGAGAGAGAGAGSDTLLAATEDRLHQQYRAATMPQTAELIERLRGAGHAAVLSGAGPTVLVLTRSQVEIESVRTIAPRQWRLETPAVDRRGVRSAGDVTRL